MEVSPLSAPLCLGTKTREPAAPNPGECFVEGTKRIFANCALDKPSTGRMMGRFKKDGPQLWRIAAQAEGKAWPFSISVVLSCIEFGSASIARIGVSSSGAIERWIAGALGARPFC
jgi:hypothetical protein